MYVTKEWKDGLMYHTMIWLAVKDYQEKLEELKAPQPLIGEAERILARVADELFDYAASGVISAGGKERVARLWEVAMDWGHWREDGTYNYAAALECFRELVYVWRKYSALVSDNPYQE